LVLGKRLLLLLGKRLCLCLCMCLCLCRQLQRQLQCRLLFPRG
jgi:hypothetical protein